jgi:hypothetical protein
MGSHSKTKPTCAEALATVREDPGADPADSLLAALAVRWRDDRIPRRRF